ALFTGMFTFASLAGPAAGGLLADGPGWRWCFYINLPIGIIASAFIVMRMPRGGGTGGRVSDIDFPGAALLSAATVVFMLAIVWASGKFGWASAPTVALFASAVVLAVVFIRHE